MEPEDELVAAGHVMSPHCWCEPRVDLADEDDPGAGLVIVHRSAAEAN